MRSSSPRGPSETLNRRKEVVLNIIVGRYIRTASPVGSQGIARDYGLGISPATVRNDMAELEEEGYIKRPHTSAGGVPSDKAYRFYVERLEDIPQAPPGMRSLVRKGFAKVDRDLESWMRLAATLLARVVQNVAIVTVPREEQSRIKRLELVQLQEFLALLILVLREARLRQQLLPLREPVAQDDLEAVANKLSDTFAGMTWHQVRTTGVELSPLESRVMEEAVHLMQAEDREVLLNHYMEGLGNVLGQPEFSRGGRAREVVEVLQDSESVHAMLSHACDSGVRVVIGEENIKERLHPFSVVMCQYGPPEGATGLLGAIGPTRMDYATTIASVQCMSAFMSDLMSGIQGRAN